MHRKAAAVLFSAFILCVLHVRAAVPPPRADIHRASNTPSVNVRLVSPSSPRFGHQPHNGHSLHPRQQQSYGIQLSPNRKFGGRGKKNASPSPIALPLGKRVYNTNLLPGFRKHQPSKFPPGFGGPDAADRVIIDVGANNGDEYTLRGWEKGHTVIAFEPSPMVVEQFKRLMISNRVAVLMVNIDHRNVNRSAISTPSGGVRVLIPRDSSYNAKVYLLPFALSNKSAELPFYESSCKSMNSCGKVNRLPVTADEKGNIIVQTYRIDDLILPVNIDKMWMLKIDVEGHELEVLQGARKLLDESRIEYIVVEFSPNGRMGIQWGLDLLEELHARGYTCFHLRGFGRCDIKKKRSPSLTCNYPFSTSDPSKAPTFKEYAEVFRMKNQKEQKPHMADLVCKRRES